jgi:hypothetical protein
MFKKLVANFVIGTAVSPVLAHDGHGMSASIGHWHATDVWGFVAVAAMVAVAVWWARRK